MTSERRSRPEICRLIEGLGDAVQFAVEICQQQTGITNSSVSLRNTLFRVMQMELSTKLLKSCSESAANGCAAS